jgi:inner membrane protein involved in colicin E2 resistance
VTAVMYFTRNIDWYSSIPAGGTQPSEAAEKNP